MRNKDEIFDFKPFGKAIKQARIQRQWTRNEAAELLHIDPRYLTNIENKGQHTSLDVLHRIAMLFQLSVDEFYFPAASQSKSTRRRQIDNALDTFDEKGLIIMEATANGITQAAKEPET